MNPHFRSIASILAVILISADAQLLAKKRRGSATTAAYTSVSSTYERERLPNGEWKVETYAFGIGDLIDPTDRDNSLSALSFQQLGGILADALLEENYVNAKTPEETDLAIVVSWGKTIPASDSLKTTSLTEMSTVYNSLNLLKNAPTEGSGGGPYDLIDIGKQTIERLNTELSMMMSMNALSNNIRRERNNHNAKLLGYAPNMAELYRHDPVAWGPMKSLLHDMEDEIETPRYFVILQAYDFQKLWKEKERDLLWVTRFSTRAKGKKFHEEIASMAKAASSVFGQETRNIKRSLRPEKAKLGELEVMAVGKEIENSEKK